MRLRAGDKEYLLSYSANVHPGESLAELRNVVARDVRAVADLAAGPGEPFGLELRLGREAILELEDAGRLEDFRKHLAACNTFLFSINGFPLRNFHQPVVKEEVYRPDWGEPERQELTVRLCRILAALLPEGLPGTISTSPASFKPWGDHRARRGELARGFAPAVAELVDIRRRTGKLITLAIEPEPFCTLETAAEFADFYEAEILSRTAEELVDAHGLTEAEAVAALREHLGVNLDACHLAVEFEDPAAALETLSRARIKLAKLHVSAAAKIVNPAAHPAALESFARLEEPKYLHQTFAVNRRSEVCFKSPDIGEFLHLPPERLAEIAEARTHFHLPLHEQKREGVETTSDAARELLRLVAEGDLCRQIVTETYTWPLLDRSPGGITRGLAAELAWTAAALRSF